MSGRRTRRGSALVEFSLAGIASLTMLLSTLQLCIGMWQYHTIAYGVQEAARYASVHGRGCVTGTTTCGITVADIATRFRQSSPGLAATSVSLTLTTDSGAQTACSPVSSCSTNTTG